MSSPRIDLGSEELSSTLWTQVEVIQQLNRHWRCRIVMRDTPDRRPPVEDFAGETLKISTFELDGSENVIFSGFVRSMRLLYEVTGAYGAELEAVSSTWKLAQSPKLQYYRQQTAKAVAEKALSTSGLAVSGSMPAGATLSYVQWNESDFDFFARLVDDGEAWFRPAVDGSEGVEVQTEFQVGATVNWRQGEYGLLEWTTRGELQPMAAEGASYDPQKMQSKAVGGASSSITYFEGAAEQMVAAAEAKSGSLEPMWADRHRAATLEDLQMRLEREARRSLASAVTCTGISREPKVRAGDQVSVTGLPGVDATYGTTEVVHTWTPQGYENRFTATPAKRWSPNRRPARPMLDGVYPARVVDNHDPHNQGRIRIQYYWQEGNETTWVRLLSSHAGPGRGFLFLPEKGDEVMVMFEEGDAERPYVIGSAWNGVHQPPSSGFHQPGEVNGSEFAANNIKRIVTKSGHRITMVDTPGKETISLATPTNTRLMLTENHADTGRAAIVLESQGDMIFAAPNGRIHSQARFYSRDVGGGEMALAQYVKKEVSPKQKPFPFKSPATLANLPKKARMAYRKSLIAAGRHQANVMPPGPARTALVQSCDRFQRDNHAMEMANLSQAVYSDHGAPEGWTRLSDPNKLSVLPPGLQDPLLWNDPNTNYHAGLFQSSDGQIVMAERGTNPKNWNDVKTDLQQGWGSDTKQYVQGMKLAQVIQKNYPGLFADITGHSLGGGRAAADSAVTGVPATTFNAAGLNANTVAPYGVTLGQAAGKVHNYNVDGQILNDLKGISIASHNSPDPLGTNVPLAAVDPHGNALPWPTRPAPVKEKWNPIEQGQHGVAYAKYEEAIVSDGIDRHGMNIVQNALEKEKAQDAAHITQALKTPPPAVSQLLNRI